MLLEVKSKSPSFLQVVIAGGDANSRRVWVDTLAELKHVVAGEAPSPADALPLVRTSQPDVVLLDIIAASRSLSMAADAIMNAAPRAAIVLATRNDAPLLSPDDLTGSPVMGVLACDTSPSCVDYTLRLAAARARDLADARRDVNESRQQLEDRKTIERAKGMLMRRTGASEAEAYRILQRASQDRSKPMIEVAKAVLASELPTARVG